MAETGATSGYGAVIGLSNDGTPAVFTPIAEVVAITPPGLSRTMIDATHLASPDNCREFIGGLIDSGEFSIDINFILTDSTQADLIANLHQTTAANVMRTYRIALPDKVTGTTATFSTTTVSAGAVNTTEPVKFTSTGILPTPLTGRVYWAKRLSGSTFSIHNSPAEAVAGTNAISCSGGSGTHTAWTGTKFTFKAGTSGFSPTMPLDDKISATVTFKVTGAVTVTPT